MLYKERNTKYISAYQFISLEDLGNRFEDSGIEPGSVLFNKENKNELEVCPACGTYLKDHILVQRVGTYCPGTYILEQFGQVTGFMSKENFEKLYEPIGYIWEENNGSAEQN